MLLAFGSWTVGPSAAPASAQAEYLITLTGPPGEAPPDLEAQVIDIEVSREELARRSALPPFDVDLGQLSPLNPASYATGTIVIRVFSPWGWFPRYEMQARARTAATGGGNFTTTDVGMGVLNVVGANPIVNPSFDYDPRLSPKNIDDEPLFQGTVGTLPLSPPLMLLYRTQGFYMGAWNSFLLVFAVGPQFFTPTGAESMQIQLRLRRR